MWGRGAKVAILGGGWVLAICRYFACGGGGGGSLSKLTICLGLTNFSVFFFWVLLGIEPSVELIVVFYLFLTTISAVHQFNVVIKVKTGLLLETV